jgi:chromosome partitioning protein
MAGLLRRAGASNNRILLIDTDSQAHATLVTTGRNDFGTSDSLYAVLMADRHDAPKILANAIVQSHWDSELHVLPASSLLEGAERELTGVAGAPYRLADPLSKVAGHYAAIVIDTRPSFSLMTEMALVAATDAIIPVEPRYLEAVGLLSVLNKINDIREGWRRPELRVSGILVTKMDSRIKGHNHMLDELKRHAILGKMLCGVIPANEAVSYAHRDHQSVFSYDPKAPASKAYAHLVGTLIRRLTKGSAS